MKKLWVFEWNDKWNSYADGRPSPFSSLFFSQLALPNGRAGERKGRADGHWAPKGMNEWMNKEKRMKFFLICEWAVSFLRRTSSAIQSTINPLQFHKSISLCELMWNGLVDWWDWFGEGRADSNPSTNKRFLICWLDWLPRKWKKLIDGGASNGALNPCRPLNQLSLPLINLSFNQLIILQLKKKKEFLFFFIEEWMLIALLLSLSGILCVWMVSFGPLAS